ncbi:unnamed protein product [Rotaria sp. Silwood2]|nr:unnamed protein product [Rotaria sp. Silwood2]CAF2842574.1 unnamed protein product [Rotaria sp. Silwood2]CAF3184476.1 unnamed protein product [Rotaria sp. Silwood2]CAF3241660.1 unnamed protein product [Rotaria sp. Silwood2]CAF4295753.1 unnamed protein product [Rotaria sp. Silwood2]
MSKKYCVRNLSIFENNSSSLKINISFYLNEQQRIDLNELVSQIKSIQFNDGLSNDCINSLLIEFIQLFSKYLALNIDISIATNQEDSFDMSSYSFPSCFQNQIIELITNSLQFLPADSVLIFAFDTCVPSRLLLVNHRTRGWELPGGKLEPNETEIDAIIREIREEAATELVFNSIKQIVQYRFFENHQGKIHRRTVFVGIIDSISDTLLCMDTLAKKCILPSKWTDEDIFDPVLNYSQYLKDNVYTICLKLAITRIMVDQ